MEPLPVSGDARDALVRRGALGALTRDDSPERRRFSIYVCETAATRARTNAADYFRANSDARARVRLSRNFRANFGRTCARPCFALSSHYFRVNFVPASVASARAHAALNSR